MNARAIVISVVLLGACGDHGEVTADASTVDAVPRQTVSMSQMLEPGMEIEGSWNAGPTDEIGLAIATSDASVVFDWDIHAHANGGTQDVVYAFEQTSVDYDFRPTQKTQWYLLLRNSSSTVVSLDIEMTLYGQALWIGFQ